jgi:hypothetical protein
MSKYTIQSSLNFYTISPIFPEKSVNNKQDLTDYGLYFYQSNLVEVAYTGRKIVVVLVDNNH